MTDPRETSNAKRRRRNVAEAQQRWDMRHLVDQFFVVCDLNRVILVFDEKLEWEQLVVGINEMCGRFVVEKDEHRFFSMAILNRNEIFSREKKTIERENRLARDSVPIPTISHGPPPSDHQRVYQNRTQTGSPVGTNFYSGYGSR